jgi:hypothetical protein
MRVISLMCVISVASYHMQALGQSWWIKVNDLAWRRDA